MKIKTIKKITTIILLFTAFTYIAQGKNKKKILIIESYSINHPWDASYVSEIKRRLGSKYRISTFQMNTKKVSPSKFAERSKLAWKKYKSVKPDLVILGDDNALKLLGPDFSKEKVPVIYLGINDNPQNYFSVAPANMTGVLDRPLINRSVIFINDIFNRKAKKILILFDSGTTARAVFKEQFGSKRSLTINNIKVDLKLIKGFTRWKRLVKSAERMGYDAIIVGLYHTIIDNSGRHVSSKKVLEWTSRNTKVPPFGFWDFTAGKDKTIGGVVIEGKVHGALASRMAIKILNGRSPGEIYPRTPKRGKLLYSKGQLKKFKIKLPEHIKKRATLID